MYGQQEASQRAGDCSCDCPCPNRDRSDKALPRVILLVYDETKYAANDCPDEGAVPRVNGALPPDRSKLRSSSERHSRDGREGALRMHHSGK